MIQQASNILMTGFIWRNRPERWPDPPLSGVYRLDGSGRFVTVMTASRQEA